MKTLVLATLCTALTMAGCAQTQNAGDADVAMTTLSDKSVEVGCATCIYGMDGVKGCALAAVVNDQPMLVEGVDVDLRGHDLCSASKTGIISGEVEGDKVMATTVTFE